MSDTAMTSDTISANPAIPLRRVETPPMYDPQLRKTLMFIGAQFSLAMVMSDKMPERVATETGLPVDLIKQVRAGDEPDIGVRSLAAIAKALGCPFQLAVQVPQPGQGAASD